MLRLYTQCKFAQNEAPSDIPFKVEIDDIDIVFHMQEFLTCAPHIHVNRTYARLACCGGFVNVADGVLTFDNGTIGLVVKHLQESEASLIIVTYDSWTFVAIVTSPMDSTNDCVSDTVIAEAFAVVSTTQFDVYMRSKLYPCLCELYKAPLHKFELLQTARV